MTAALATDGVVEVVVVSPDPEVLALAEAAGARPVLQQSRGLNPALHEARAARPADRLLIIPADLPAVTPTALAQVLAAGDAAGPPERGPRARPPRPRHERPAPGPARTSIDPAFGGDSRAGHAWLASSADIAFVEVPDVLDLDVDTPEDLLLAEASREAIDVD